MIWPRPSRRPSPRIVFLVGALAPFWVLPLAAAERRTGTDRLSTASPWAGRESSGTPTEAPNIILIQTDDQRTGTLAAMRTVRRQIGAAGTSFRHHFVSSPTCCPSRVSVLTGQYPHNHGVEGACAGRGGEHWERDSLAVWIREQGYRTAHVGKYLNGYGAAGSGRRTVPPGWSRWFTTIGGSTGDAYDYSINRDGRIIRFGERRRDFKQDVLSRHAIRLIRDFSSRGFGRIPFFLQVDYTAPHGAGPGRWPHPPRRCRGYAIPAPRDAKRFRRPQIAANASFNERDVADKPGFIRRRRLTRPERQTVRTRTGCQLASLLSVDDGVRGMIETLRRQGELGTTYLLFSSDNGYLAGEHRLSSGKGYAYQATSRVPLMIRGPGVSSDTVVDEATSNVDLAPTLLEITGGEPRRRLDGRSLLDPDADHGREVLIEGPPAVEPGYQALATPSFLYTEWSDARQSRELYDLRVDPFELRSRHDDEDYAASRAQLSARLAALSGCAGSSCR